MAARALAGATRLGNLAGEVAREDLRVLQQAEAQARVDAVQVLGEADAELAEALVVLGVAFDVVLERSDDMDIGRGTNSEGLGESPDCEGPELESERHGVAGWCATLLASDQHLRRILCRRPPGWCARSGADWMWPNSTVEFSDVPYCRRCNW